MSHTLQIVSINPLRSGVSKTTGNPYAIQEAECILHGDDGKQQVGVWVLPSHLTGEFAPKAGTYNCSFSLRVNLRDRRVESVISDLTPLNQRVSAPLKPAVQS
jgi:hypothetical protein